MEKNGNKIAETAGSGNLCLQTHRKKNKTSSPDFSQKNNEKKFPRFPRQSEKLHNAKKQKNFLKCSGKNPEKISSPQESIAHLHNLLLDRN